MGKRGQPRLVFELAAEPSRSGQSLTGGWTQASVPSADVVAFDERWVTMPQVSVWLADLPDDPELAGLRLTSAEDSLARWASALVMAQRRLGAFVARRRSSPSLVAAATGPGAPRPERELDGFLSAMTREEQAFSFDVDREARGSLARAAEGFDAFVRRLEQQVGHDAWIESRSQDQVWARTVVRWTGDADTVWQPRVGPVERSLHLRTVALALRSRASSLRTVAVVLRNAARLAALLAMPGGASVAQPAVWRFVHDVHEELGRSESAGLRPRSGSWRLGAGNGSAWP